MLNAVRFGAKCKKFWCKTHAVERELHIHTTSKGLATIISPAPFSTKTNLRENRLFAAGWAIGG